MLSPTSPSWNPNLSNTMTSVKAHDSKRFRLKAVSSEADVYSKYFHKAVASKVSWVQMAFAAFELIAQMMVMFILMGHREYWYSGANMGSGIWASMTAIIASVLTLWASHKPSYGKLHFSMAMHIISLLAHCVTVTIQLGQGVYNLKSSIREMRRGDYYEMYNYNGRTSYDLQPGVPEYNETSADEDARLTSEAEGKEYDLGQLHSAFVLTGMLSFAGIIQILISFFMSLKTGRAICCGRTHLEGKFLEMEVAGREDADAVVNFKAKEGPSDHVESSQRSPGSSGPPPYDAELFATPASPNTA